MDFWTQATTVCLPLILTYFFHPKVHFSLSAFSILPAAMESLGIWAASTFLLLSIMFLWRFWILHCSLQNTSCLQAVEILTGFYLELNKSYLNGLQWPRTATLLGNSRSTLHTTLKPTPAAELCAACRDNENFPIAALQLMKTLFSPPVKTDTGYLTQTIKRKKLKPLKLVLQEQKGHGKIFIVSIKQSRLILNVCLYYIH